MSLYEKVSFCEKLDVGVTFQGAREPPKMRPTSRYLYSMIHETPKCRLNFSGSTPPFSGNADFFANMGAPITREVIDATTSAVQNELAKRAGAKPEEFRFAPGSSSVFTQALAAISEPGDRILIESPAYDPFPTCAEFLGLKPEFFNRTFDRERDLGALKAKCKRARILVLSNPNCPTGLMSSREDLLTLSRIFKWVIIDEVFLPLFADGAITLLPGELPSNILLIGSLSKSIGLSAARFGWLRAQPKVLEKFEKIGYNFHIEMPAFSLAAARNALAHWDDLIAKNLKALAKPRAQFKGLPFSHDLSRGHFATLRAPKEFRDGDEFAARVLRDHDIWLRPTRLFRLPKQVRVSFFMADVDAKYLSEALGAYY